MKLLKKKTTKKPNLLELSNPERVQLIKEAREQLKEAIMEAKLWQSLIEIENLAVNGAILTGEKLQIGGFCPERTI